MADRFKHTRDLRRAFGLLTVVPTPVEWIPERGAQVAGWFTWVGFALGLVVWAPLVVLDEVGIDRLPSGVVAAVVLAVWAGLTRMLHWDGLADVADGWWGGATKQRRLEIMKDSSIGAFGATAIALVALLEFSALSTLVDFGWASPLLWAAAVSRMASTFGAWLGKPARSDGLGAGITGRPELWAMLAAGLGLALAILPLAYRDPVAAIVLGVVGIVLALGVPHVISLRFGGVTGDVMGASVLVTEAIVLAAAAFMAVVR
ncbi:MAG: adenosylcobinamide-GDP ribazoletransferase [Coriobacteriales bacterium]|nr:adenosylcobinamide-GDP ribazoletransferase [Coriobacteriales bacterium]